MAEGLRAKMRVANINIEFTDQGKEAAEIEFGNTTWDDRMMRVCLRIEKVLPPEESLASLKAAGFSLGLPSAYC